MTLKGILYAQVEKIEHKKITQVIKLKTKQINNWELCLMDKLKLKKIGVTSLSENKKVALKHMES